MSPLRTSFVLNTSWKHYVGFCITLFSFALGLFRFVLYDWADPYHCKSLTNRGTWLDGSYKNWQPDGCMLHTYLLDESAFCLQSKELVFIGDSLTRKLFFQVAHLLDAKLPTSPPDDDRKHSDHTLHTNYQTTVSFFWDPFLNTSHTTDVLKITRPSIHHNVPQRPALLVLGSGLWYLRYANSSGGVSVWEANMEHVLTTIARSPTKPADTIVVLPIEDIVSSKLSPERAATMHPSDIEAMNSDLFHRIYPPSDGHMSFFERSSAAIPVTLPLVFNQMLVPSLTEDGLHFSDSLISIQANILLNLRCNDVLPKHFPLNKTCCNRYPWPSFLHFIIIAFAVLLGPFVALRSGYPTGSTLTLGEKEKPLLIMSLAVGLIYIADRTHFWLKEQKQFNSWTVTFLFALSLAIGLATVRRVDKDLDFLNRDQTDEWKGWMQVAILIYHYFGASKISGIYNPIRVLVASYLFMTGYGHTTFYLLKAEFGFLRFAQVMIRLNLLTIILAYTMNTNYISYYFTPLVSMWYILLYVTLAIGWQYNTRAYFLVFKILVSSGFVTWLTKEPWLMKALFDMLGHVFGIHWSAREWVFRVKLDLWIVYVGMLSALIVINVREHRLMESHYWPFLVKFAVAASVLVLIWFFAFELQQETKFAYNTWHPYISFLPILAFTILRNSNPVLRSAHSRAFAFVGRCSLETFIIQYHFWLAGDTKGVLLVVPGTWLRPINFIITTIMFIYVCYQVALATGELTNRICGVLRVKTLPLSVTHSDVQRTNQDSEVPEHIQPVCEGSGPASLTRVRWLERLAEGPFALNQATRRTWFIKDHTWGLKTKLMIIMCIMWLVNILWSNPYIMP